jgi:hypothetical protein
MKDWHVRHKIFHQIFKDKDMGDDLSNYKIIEEWEKESIVKRAVQYPTIQQEELYYPGKSYSVAITFAKLLEKNFGEDFYESLDDELLLFGNDPYHKRYSEEKEVYDEILKDFPFEALENDNLSSEDYKKTMHYFYLEFLLDDETKMFAPS